MAKCKICSHIEKVYEFSNKPKENSEYPWCSLIEDSPDVEMERECDYFQHMTNGEKVRKMDDEELAELLFDSDTLISCEKCGEPTNTDGKCIGRCVNEFLRWLRRPVEDVCGKS